jgi:hypothetical protein
MNDFGRVFGITMFVAYGLALTPFLLLSLAVPYAVLRLRGQDGIETDPQVGLKVLLYFFFSVGVLLFLTGTSVIAVDAVTDRPQQQQQPFGGPFGPPHRARTFNTAQRTGTALAVTGVLFALFHLVLVKMMTNDRRWPAARRLFAGWRLAVSGVVLLLTVTALILTLFQEDLNEEVIKTTLAIGFVWSLAWVTDLCLLWFYSKAMPRAEKARRPLELPRAED